MTEFVIGCGYGVTSMSFKDDAGNQVVLTLTPEEIEGHDADEVNGPP